MLVTVASLEAPLAAIYGFVGKPIRAVEGDGSDYYGALLGSREF